MKPTITEDEKVLLQAYKEVVNSGKELLLKIDILNGYVKKSSFPFKNCKLTPFRLAALWRLEKATLELMHGREPVGRTVVTSP